MAYAEKKDYWVGEELIIKLGQDALRVTAMVGGPILVSTFVIGVIVSIFQALTQINEATLTFVPKLIVVAVVLIIAGPWMLDVMRAYTIELFTNLAMFVRD